MAEELDEDAVEYQPPTVADLIERLSALDPALPVVLSADEEGNQFDFLHEAHEALLHVEWKEWYMTPEQYAEEMAKPGTRFGAEDEPPAEDDVVRRVVILWP